jgi:hypothetical protein
MDVRFSASNLRAVNWFGRCLANGAAFIVLWVVAGIALARRQAKAN